ncbi:MAG: zinc ABC transporter substrate-binding protein [Actinomycetota bacterium]
MRRVALVTIVVGMLAAACGGGNGGGQGADGRLGVVASFYPLAEAAQRVGGDRVQVTNLTPAGAEPHDLELTTRDIDRVESAALVVYLGAGFQPAIERAVERARGRAIDVLDDLDLLDGHEDHDDGHDDDHDDGHGHEEGDPHVWLDPTIMKRIAAQVAEALAEADPDGRATYLANAEAYGRELDALDAEMRQGLAQCARRVIVTSHDAFGYLAQRYNLVQEPISGLSPEAEPDPRRMAQLVDMVRSTGTTTIFYETLVSPRVAEALAREAGVRVAVLNPLEGLTDEEARAGKTYAAIMRENLGTLRPALGCT